MIDTREELIIALEEAAELEHGLMVQYLYAAMTLKRGPEDGLNDEQSATVGTWRESIYMVARQEMGHLGTVQNILTSIGGAPHFDLPRFPVTSKYYEPPQEFTLEPLRLDVVDRFIAFEAPLPPPTFGLLDLQPDPLEYRSVGDLYTQILEGIRKVPGDVLFVGPASGQDVSRWSQSVSVLAARSIEESEAAIRHIIEEGEATTAGGPESHYHRFRRIREEYVEELQRNPSFKPYRPVASNPTTDPAGGQRRQVLRQEPALGIAKLFNSVYKTTLFALGQSYKFQETFGVPFPDVDTARELRKVCMGLMQGIIRELGQEVLPDLVADGTGVMAAPPFEVYGYPRPAWDRRVVWKLLHERLKSERIFADNLAGTNPGLVRVAESLKLLEQQVEELIG